MKKKTRTRVVPKSGFFVSLFDVGLARAGRHAQHGVVIVGTRIAGHSYVFLWVYTQQI